MSHTALADAAAAVTIQAGAVVSKVIYRDENVNVTVPAMAGVGGVSLRTTSTSSLLCWAANYRTRLPGPSRTHGWDWDNDGPPPPASAR